MFDIKTTNLKNEDLIEVMRNHLGSDIMHALADYNITEICVNTDSSVWLEKGTEGLTHVGDINPHDTWAVCRYIAAHREVSINYDNPIIDTALPRFEPFNGARINMVLPPIAVSPSFTIRKHNKEVIPLDSYISKGIMTEYQADIIREAISNYKNIIVAGAPKAGKSTLTNAILHEMTMIVPRNERILICEDTPELKCNMPNVNYYLTKKSDNPTKNVGIRELIQLAMRSRPDRILVGEVRDGAALELLKAWNTGCPGGISTVHSNSARGTIQRLIDLSLEATQHKPFNEIKEGVNVVVYIDRNTKYKASRKVTEIFSVEDYDSASETFQFKQLDI